MPKLIKLPNLTFRADDFVSARITKRDDNLIIIVTISTVSGAFSLERKQSELICQCEDLEQAQNELKSLNEQLEQAQTDDTQDEIDNSIPDLSKL